MKVSELARTTGVPVPTIKYYLREGMLMLGHRMSANQAWYDHGHVRRLRMIRALVDLGGLSIAAVKAILAAINGGSGLEACRAGALTATEASGMDSEFRPAARELVDRVMTEHGLDHAGTRQALMAAVTAILDLGRGDLLDLLEPYVAACARLTSLEAAMLRDFDDVEGAALAAVLGNVVLSAGRFQSRHGCVRGRPERGDGQQTGQHSRHDLGRPADSEP